MPRELRRCPSGGLGWMPGGACTKPLFAALTTSCSARISSPSCFVAWGCRGIHNLHNRFVILNLESCALMAAWAHQLPEQASCRVLTAGKARSLTPGSASGVWQAPLRIVSEETRQVRVLAQAHGHMVGLVRIRRLERPQAQRPSSPAWATLHPVGQLYTEPSVLFGLVRRVIFVQGPQAPRSLLQYSW